MSGHVRIEQQGDIAVLHIDRPPANAMDPELLDEGSRVLADLARDDPAAVVITGREGFFSAGLDLKVVPTLSPEEATGMVDGINRLFATAYTYPGPLVCAVTGHAIAGGFILAICGDHRVGSTEGKLGLTEVRAGVPYPAVAMAVVRAELAPAAARQLVLRAELFGPEVALELGVVDELAAPDQVLPRALEVAGELAALPRSTYRTVKAQFRRDAYAEIERVLSGEAEAMQGGWLAEETTSAAAAVLRGSRTS
jgi:enoyl-CoA hydratase/carnithine racemase